MAGLNFSRRVVISCAGAGICDCIQPKPAMRVEPVLGVQKHIVAHGMTPIFLVVGATKGETEQVRYGPKSRMRAGAGSSDGIAGRGRPFASQRLHEVWRCDV